MSLDQSSCIADAARIGQARLVACYRIANQNWPNDKALAEAKQYGMSWTEVSMQNFVRHFQAAAFAGIAPAPNTGSLTVAAQ